MDKFEGKRLFWKVADTLIENGDTTLSDDALEVVERGILLSNGYCILYNYKKGIIKIYDREMCLVLGVQEKDAELLLSLKEMFLNVEDV